MPVQTADNISLNSQGNYTEVNLNETTLYFSYKTLIGLRKGTSLIVCENVWGVNTGKHLNMIDGGSSEAKKRRLKLADFKAAVNRLDVNVP